MTKAINLIWTELSKSKNVLLTLHPSPDGDSFGSNLALMLALMQLNKKVTLISGDSPLPKYLKQLPGSGKITVSNIFDLDLSKFDTMAILDISSPNQITKLGEITFPPALNTINIDHHASNVGFTNFGYIDKKSPATCQMVYKLLSSNKKIQITPEIADSLFIGLYTDTGGFKYPGTTYRTFNIASKLSRVSSNFSRLIFEMENNDEPDRLKFLALMLGSIETYFSGHVAISSVPYQKIKEGNYNRSVIESLDVANMLKAVVGWDIGISFVEYQPGSVKVSLRTRDAAKYDLSRIASATGSGGGLKAAAGAKIDKEFSEAKKFLLNIIADIHPELGDV